MYKPHLFSEKSTQKSWMWLIYGNIQGRSSSCVMPRLLSTFQSLATKQLCISFQLPSNFNFMDCFKVIILKKKKIALREDLKFLHIVCPCLFTNRTSLKLTILLSLLFFFKIWASKLGVGLIYACGSITWTFTVPD